MSKIREYFSTIELTRGFFIALLGSAFLYLEHFGLSHPIINSILGIATLYFLIQANKTVWFFSGFFTSLLWFWWITLSFFHYHMIWAIPIALLFIGVTYGGLFWLISKIAFILTNNKSVAKQYKQTLFTMVLKALALLGLSYIHPFGFDWYKPELMFVHSYFGIEKWQFFLILASIVLSLWKKNYLFLVLSLLAYQPLPTLNATFDQSIAIIETDISVEEKWNETLHVEQFNRLLKRIDAAIIKKKRLIILPESIFPVYVNLDKNLSDALLEKSKKASLVLGGLYWDGETPRNSTYIFKNGQVEIANKVLLVPFGESNPLPDFLGDWVNEVFYDGAVDYKASSKPTDYTIDSKKYRNAICFEATSEKLYRGEPKNMIVLSNNGWFTPSVEPTLQKILLQYYSKKYGTTIYHSINKSKSYIVENGAIRSIK